MKFKFRFLRDAYRWRRRPLSVKRSGFWMNHTARRRRRHDACCVSDWFIRTVTSRAHGMIFFVDGSSVQVELQTPMTSLIGFGPILVWAPKDHNRKVFFLFFWLPAVSSWAGRQCKDHVKKLVYLKSLDLANQLCATVGPEIKGDDSTPRSTLDFGSSLFKDTLWNRKWSEVSWQSDRGIKWKLCARLVICSLKYRTMYQLD